MSSESLISRRFRAGAALIAAAVMLLVVTQSAFAEGSFDINVGAGTTLRNQLATGAGINGPNHNGYTVLRAYARAGETIQMGSSAMELGGTSDIRVYAPGTSFASTSEPGGRAVLPTDPVFGTEVFDCDADAPGTGRIAKRTEEEAGPAPNPNGYKPCEYTAPADGIYPIVMLPYGISGTLTGSTVAAPNSSIAQGPAIAMWDVTVRAGGVVQPGRVFTNILELAIPTAVSNVSDLSAFVYTPAGFVYHATIFNPKGKLWDLAANRSGVIDATTGSPILGSFQWGPTSGYPPTLAPTYGDAVAPQMWEGDAPDDSRFPLFFRTPDPVAISGPGGLAETSGYSPTPIAPEGGLSGALSFTGSGGEAGATVQGSGGTIAIDAPALRGEEFAVTLDLDRDGTFGGGDDVEYTGTMGSTGASVAWDGRDSNGDVVPCGVSYPFQATSTLPGMHLVQSDTNAEAGTRIERVSLPLDPLLGNPLAASYNDVDPYKGTAVTSAVPSAVSEGTSGPTFHAWTTPTGHADFVDTWASSHPVDGTGTLEVKCPPPTTSTSPEASPPSTSTPPSVTPPSTTSPPASAPPARAEPPRHHAKPKKHHHQHQTQDGPPRLSLTLDATTGRARPSSVIGYRITVRNSGASAARNVKVCDRVPAGQEVLRTTPTAAGEAEPCWAVGVLDAGASRVFRLTAMVGPLSGSTVQRNAASAEASNVKGTRTDRVAVRIAPLPETACGSSLSGAPGPSSLTYRC